MVDVFFQWKKTSQQPVVESVLKKLDGFLGALSLPNSSFGQQLPPSIRSVLPASRASFPLGFGHAAQYVAPGAALIG